MSPSVTNNDLVVTPATNVNYFTPLNAIGTSPPGGPSLFSPIKLRGLTLPNRIWLAPLCQYSADDGAFTPWHTAHLGGILARGPGLTVVEASAVTPEGRITPHDAGIWNDRQKESMRPVVEFAHAQGAKIGIQIAHAGRKASTVPPWLSFGATATKENGGWPDNVVAPSAEPYNEKFPFPRALTEEEIKDTVKAFAEAAKRAVEVGFDTVEIHAAHGYLIHEFLSPIVNKRTDRYGGSFENRIRLLLEVTDAVREAIPEDMPLLVRISATDWAPEGMDSWTVEQSAKLAPILAAHGVDLIDVSSGGLTPLQKIKAGPAFQAPFAKEIKKALEGTATKVSTVGSITSGTLAQSLLDDGSADVVTVGKGFIKNPGLVWSWAEELGVALDVPVQMKWPFAGRASSKPKSKYSIEDGRKLVLTSKV